MTNRLVKLQRWDGIPVRVNVAHVLTLEEQLFYDRGTTTPRTRITFALARATDELGHHELVSEQYLGSPDEIALALSGEHGPLPTDDPLLEALRGLSRERVALALDGDRTF